MRRALPLAVFLTVLCFAGVAQAEFYLGASYLSTDAEIEEAFESFDTDDSAYKFFAGFTIFKFFGVEASYRDLGTHEETVGSSSVNFDLEAIDLSARGILPIGRFRLFAKVGYARIAVDGDFIDNGMPGSVDDDEFELMYGVGVEVHFGGFFGLRAEWEEYDVSGGDLNSLSGGAVFRF